MRKQEVHLLSSQILHICHELMDAQAEADHQIGIHKCQMGRMSNNISCLSNRPCHPFDRRSMMSSIMEHGGCHKDNITAPIITVAPVANKEPTFTDEVYTCGDGG